MDFMTKGNQFPSQPQPQQHHSLQYNIRSNLLSDDIGHIDITKETPINMPKNNGNNNNSFNQQQQFQNYNNMYMNQQPSNVSYINNNNNNNSNIQLSSQYKNKPATTRQEKRTSSLNQNSIANFFKGKNHGGFRFGTNKSKKQNHSDSHGNGDEDDDDVFIDDPTSSTLTFNDIQKYGFKNGDKLNVTEDTTPLIPTIVTKQTNNMNNVEYRKFLNTQKKNVLNALNNQNKLSPSPSPIRPQNMINGNMNGFNNSQPQFRTMSLQNGYNGRNPYFMQPQQQQQFRPQNGMPYTGVNRSNSNIPNVGGPRTNSLMTGGMQYTQHFERQQGNDMSYPRTMSLTNNSQQLQNRGNGFNNSHMQQQFVNNGPNPSKMDQQMQPQYRTMSLQQRPTMNAQQFTDNTRTNRFQQSQFQSSQQQQPLQQQPVPAQSLQRQVPAQNQSQYQLQQQGQRCINNNDNMNNSDILINNNNVNGSNTINTIDNTEEQSIVIVPQSNNNEANIPLNEDNPQSIYTINKAMGETTNEQTSQTNPNVNKPKLNIIKLSKPQQDDLLQKENIINHSIKKVDQTPINDMVKQVDSTSQEPDLRPSSLLQGGLNSLNLNDNNARDSTITQISSFSVSPVKQQERQDQSIYKLANGTDSKAFVTAEEFPPLNYDNNINKNDISKTNNPIVEPNRNPRRNSAMVVAPASKRISIYKNSGSSISSTSYAASKGSIETEKKTQHTSPSTIVASRIDSKMDYDDKVSISESDTSDINDTFVHKHSPATPTQHTTKSQSNGEEKSSEDFVFDNTLYSPYNDITQTASKMIYISKEQMGLLNENKRLMKELTLLSTELAESIKRETLLEDKIKNIKQSNESNNQSQRSSTSSIPSISYTDFETELRRKSSKIVELIQALNDERMKRFIAEEQLLLKENNASPSSLDLIKKINDLQDKLQIKENAINDLKSALSNM